MTIECGSSANFFTLLSLKKVLKKARFVLLPRRFTDFKKITHVSGFPERGLRQKNKKRKREVCLLRLGYEPMIHFIISCSSIGYCSYIIGYKRVKNLFLFCDTQKLIVGHNCCLIRRSGGQASYLGFCLCPARLNTVLAKM